MPFALIPDGFSLKKVTKLQEKAVKDKRRHDDVVAFLSNPNTPTLIGGAGFLALSGILIDLLFGSLEQEGIPLTEQQKTTIKKGFDLTLLTNPVTGPVIIGKKAFDALLDVDFSDLEKRFSGLKPGGLA